MSGVGLFVDVGLGKGGGDGSGWWQQAVSYSVRVRFYTRCGRIRDEMSFGNFLISVCDVC